MVHDEGVRSPLWVERIGAPAPPPRSLARRRPRLSPRPGPSPFSSQSCAPSRRLPAPVPVCRRSGAVRVTARDRAAVAVVRPQPRAGRRVVHRPDHGGWLRCRVAGRLADMDHRVMGVIGASGGLGVSTLAVALAVRAGSGRWAPRWRSTARPAAVRWTSRPASSTCPGCAGPTWPAAQGGMDGRPCCAALPAEGTTRVLAGAGRGLADDVVRAASGGSGPGVRRDRRRPRLRSTGGWPTQCTDARARRGHVGAPARGRAPCADTLHDARVPGRTSSCGRPSWRRGQPGGGRRPPRPAAARARCATTPGSWPTPTAARCPGARASGALAALADALLSRTRLGRPGHAPGRRVSRVGTMTQADADRATGSAAGKVPTPAAGCTTSPPPRPLGSATTGVESARAALASEVLGLGPLEPCVADPDVTDVLVNGDGSVWLDRGGGLQWFGPQLVLDPPAARRLAVRLAGLAGRRLDESQAWVDGLLPRGIRLHAILPPLVDGGAHVSLRVPRASGGGSAGAARARDVRQPRSRAAACTGPAPVARSSSRGGTGCGKTTLLAAMLAEVPDGRADRRRRGRPRAGRRAPPRGSPAGPRRQRRGPRRGRAGRPRPSGAADEAGPARRR